MNVADALTSIDVQDGACIIRQGDAAVDGMYFIEDGRCRVTYLNEVSGLTWYLLIFICRTAKNTRSVR